VNAGDMTVVQCAIIKGDSPITISWFFNGVEITPGYQDILIGKISQRISTLSIEAVKARHSGDYTCRASNAAGKIDHTAHLRVNGNTPYSVCLWEFVHFVVFSFAVHDKIILFCSGHFLFGYEAV
jgi:hypothetical protein